MSNPIVDEMIICEEGVAVFDFVRQQNVFFFSFLFYFIFGFVAVTVVVAVVFIELNFITDYCQNCLAV